MQIWVKLALRPGETSKSTPLGDDINPFTNLRHAKLVGRQNPRIALVSSLFEQPDYPSPSFACIVLKQVWHIFQQQVFRFVVFENCHDPVEKVAPTRAVKAILIPGFGKRLTRKSRTQNFMGRNCRNRNFANIATRRDAKVLKIDVLQLGIQFAGKNTTMPHLLKREMEAAKSCKQVNKSHRIFNHTWHKIRLQDKLRWAKNLMECPAGLWEIRHTAHENSIASHRKAGPGLQPASHRDGP
jgi:hypothetical protein